MTSMMWKLLKSFVAHTKVGLFKKAATPPEQLTCGDRDG
jgi:hypothetical protein